MLGLESLSINNDKYDNQIFDDNDIFNFNNLTNALNINEIHTHDLDNLNSQLLTNTDLNTNLIIAHFNVRSLNANFSLLESFIYSLEKKPHVIVCTETRFVEYLQFYNLTDYTSYYNESQINICDGTFKFYRTRCIY